jgi:protein-L-isoaspartate(D-aspartate) O-methyltransferase
MIRTIRLECEYASAYTGRPEIGERVLDAMEQVPRDEFVPPSLRSFAFDNRALPIGRGQTISQPFIVALMTDLLNPEKEHRVLEIGTGSGYQAAILSLLVKQVYSIEIVPTLAEGARRRLDRLGYRNVEVRACDGYRGWDDHAPFDGIMVTAAASHVPGPLVEQLKPGASLVLPIGLPGMHQELMTVHKGDDGQIRTRQVLGVAFVPLTGSQGKEP